MRLLSLLADFFVIYHAKDLKITDPELEMDTEGDDNTDLSKPIKSNEQKLNNSEIVNNTNKNAKLLDSADLFQNKQKNSSFSKNIVGEGVDEVSSKTLMKKGHQRSVSRDFHSLNPKNELNATIWRKSSHHIAGPITEF